MDWVMAEAEKKEEVGKKDSLLESCIYMSHS